MIEIRSHRGVREVPQAAWDAVVGDASPFLEWTWLAAMEEGGCVGEGTGWTPCPVTVWEGGRLVGVAPAYVKAHSYGEYVYDWQIAAFARQNGLRWYPKLVVAVPFTPVAGPRLVVAAGADRGRVLDALTSGLRAIGAKIAGLHVLFPSGEEPAELVARGGALRVQWQYHWHNRGYGSFDDWVATFPSKRRGAIRRERREAAVVRVEARVGSRPGLGALLWGFYENTYRRHTGGEGYLTAAFFEILCARWAHRIHTVLASDGDDVIAGTFNVLKGDRLYGRWWGCTREVPFLHFEVAIYAAVEWCIQNGVQVFEPGHGGDHKRARGFSPVLTHSVHWITDPRLDGALRDFFRREGEAVRAALEEP